MALTKEEIQAIGEIVEKKLDARLSPIENDIKEMKSDIAQTKEDISDIKKDVEITREATNSLIEWADNVSVITQIKAPVEKNN